MNKLYAAGAIVIGLIVAFLRMFAKGAASATNKIKAESEEKARESQERSSDAVITGLTKEQEVRSEKVDTVKRDYDPN